jgi:hypothetical protein
MKALYDTSLASPRRLDDPHPTTTSSIMKAAIHVTNA